MKAIVMHKIREKQIMISMILFIVTALAITSQAVSAQITASGCSVSNMGYLSDLSKVFEKRTGIKVMVRGGGSVVGIADLHEGRVDFAASCRARSAEDPSNLVFIQIAWDVLVPIVHPSNPVNDISSDNIKNIFLSHINNWEQLKGRKGPITLFLARPGKGLSGVESSIRSMILNGKEPVITPDVNLQQSSGVVEQMVEKTVLGFAVSGFSSARKRSVKMLKVNGISPIQKNIANNKYPFRRPLFLIVPKDAKPEVKRFVDFAVSREGQQLINSFGVVPFIPAK